jgi:hypothetical protein
MRVPSLSAVDDDVLPSRKRVAPVAMMAFHTGPKLARVASTPFSVASVRLTVRVTESTLNSALSSDVSRRLTRPPKLRPRFRSMPALVNTGSRVWIRVETGITMNPDAI